MVQHGMIQSRERAKALIMAGVVFVNEQKVDKAGEMIKEDAKVEVRGHDIGYVSRGGLKLEKAMQCFPLTPRGKVCMDIGASTGGFTDCMLQNGAVKVYAVDVGYGQLAWSLRTDERVVNMERTNIRNVTPDMLAERWTGKRFTPEEARARSGVAQIASSGEWENRLKLLMRSGRFERIAMDLYRHDPEDADTESIRMARKLRKWYPAATLTDISRQIRRQRTIKQPCEIEAMREAVKITRDGILAMMKASKPGMYEYQYKAEFDYALAQHGCLAPAFPSIISAGANNFCIHYYEYTGQAKDGDMILRLTRS